MDETLDEWKNELPHGHFHPNAQADTDGEKELLFVYQTKWQHNLLERYGNDICLMDDTYHTTKYAVPLLFIYLKTNYNHMVVGVYACETESKACISEDLRIFKQWNLKWKPH